MTSRRHSRTTRGAGEGNDVRASRDSRPPAHPPAGAQPCCWPATAPSSLDRPAVSGRRGGGVEQESRRDCTFDNTTWCRDPFRRLATSAVRGLVEHASPWLREKAAVKARGLGHAGWQSTPHCELSGRPSGIASFDNAPPSAWPPTVQDARASTRQELDAGPHVEPADVKCPATLNHGSQQGQRTPWTCPRFAAIAEP